MSGVTEVRLYRNTVDDVPAEYTNVTAAVLNSSMKNHATGVKRYLDGVTTVSGLDPGANYFWVELIDARGNTAGPQPVGSYTTATVWEFYVSVTSRTNAVLVWDVVTEGLVPSPDNAKLGEGWSYFQVPEPVPELTAGALSEFDKRKMWPSAWEGTKLWTLFDYSQRVGPRTFEVTWSHPRYTPGLRILRDGVEALNEGSSHGGGDNTFCYTVVYEV